VVGIICDTLVSNVNAAVDYRYIFVFINGNFDCICNNLSNNDCICCIVETCCAFNSLNCQFAFCANLSGVSGDYQIVSFNCDCICCSSYFDNSCSFALTVIIYFVLGSRIAYQLVEFKVSGQFQFESLTNFKVANVRFNLQFSFQSRDTFFCDFCYLFHGSFNTCVFNFCECQVICCYHITVNGDCSLFANGCAFQLHVGTQFNGDDVFVFQFNIFDCQLEAVFFYICDCRCSYCCTFNKNIFCNFCCRNCLEFSTIQCECQFMLGCRTCCILTVTVNLQLQFNFFVVQHCFFVSIFSYINRVDYFSYCFSRTCVSKCCCGHQGNYHSCSHDHRDKFLHWSHSSFF